MSVPENPTPVSNDLPDVASTHAPKEHGTLDWVGMSAIDLPLMLADSQRPTQQVNAKVQTYVNLNNANVKGIHMSRLYLLLTEYAAQNTLTASGLREFLAHLLDSHHDISDQARLRFDFEYVINQPALKSQYSGWKAYPAAILGTLSGSEVHLETFVGVPYSSTCPCSAALARQIIQQRFSKDFADRAQLDRQEVEAWLRSERGTSATPHSQRSLAKVWVKLADDVADFPFSDLIGQVESALGTPVQTAVKREDEQEFARLNGENLMFCEDAARRIKSRLHTQTHCQDYWIRVEHYESLHAHGAVSITTKGVANGYAPSLYR